MAKPLAPASNAGPAVVPSPGERRNDLPTVAGAGAQGHSRTGDAPSGTTSFDAVRREVPHFDAMRNQNRQLHEDMLTAELQKPDGHDVEQVESILKVLVAENYTVHKEFQGGMQDQTAKDLAKVLAKLGEEAKAAGLPIPDQRVDARMFEVSPQAVAMARQSSETAKRLAAQMKDPACRQLLERVGQFWESYVRSVPKRDTSHAVGTWKVPSLRVNPFGDGKSASPHKRSFTNDSIGNTSPRIGISSQRDPSPSTPRPLTPNASDSGASSRSTSPIEAYTTTGNPSAVTTATTSNTTITTTAGSTSSASASPRQVTPPTPKAMRQLAAKELQNPDVVQKRAKQRDALFAALATKNPLEIAKALEELPEDVTLASYLPVANPEKFRDELLASARQYAATFSPDNSLVDYLQWFARHHQLSVDNNRFLAQNPEVKNDIKPKVIELCTALKNIDETADEATLKKSAGAIKKLMSSTGITALSLAEQPLAGTRMMLQKCALLKKHMGVGSKTFGSLQTMLEQAHTWRKMAHVRLQAELLKKPFYVSNLVNVRDLIVMAYARAMTTPTVGYVHPDATQDQLKTMLENIDKVLVKLASTDDKTQTTALVAIRTSIMDRFKKASSLNH